MGNCFSPLELVAIVAVMSRAKSRPFNQNGLQKSFGPQLKLLSPLSMLPEPHTTQSQNSSEKCLTLGKHGKGMQSPP